MFNIAQDHRIDRSVFLGENTPLKFVRHYNQKPSGLFSIFPLVRTLMTSSQLAFHRLDFRRSLVFGLLSPRGGARAPFPNSDW